MNFFRHVGRVKNEFFFAQEGGGAELNMKVGGWFLRIFYISPPPPKEQIYK